MSWPKQLGIILAADEGLGEVMVLRFGVTSEAAAWVSIACGLVLWVLGDRS